MALDDIKKLPLGGFFDFMVIQSRSETKAKNLSSYTFLQRDMSSDSSVPLCSTSQ
jgi:hypothetical protein